MRRSATCSETRRLNQALRAAMLMALIVGASATEPPLFAKVLMTQEEALKAAFPGETDVKRTTAYLTDEQAAAVESLCTGEKSPTRIVTYYTGRSGTAWFDSHIVRTLPETIMVVVTPEGSIARIDILSFGEPLDYMPRTRWFEQLHGRGLDEDLSLRRGVRPITGATLSARAIVSAARRVLAMHRVITGLPASPGKGGGSP